MQNVQKKIQKKIKDIKIKMLQKKNRANKSG